MAARWENRPKGRTDVYRAQDGWWYINGQGPGLGPARWIDTRGEDSAGNTTAVPQGRPQDALPAAPPAPAADQPAAAAPAAPATPPTNPWDARVSELQGRREALAPTYNEQRRQAGQSAATGLVESGLADTADTSAETQTWGSQPYEQATVYKLVLSPDGRLYRQAYRDTRAAFNARGMLSSSFTDTALTDRRRDLDLSRTRAVRSSDEAQRGLVDRQKTATQKAADDIWNAQQQGAAWSASQPAPAPDPAQMVAASAPAAPAAPETPSVPGQKLDLGPLPPQTTASFVKNSRSAAARAFRAAKPKPVTITSERHGRLRR